MTPKQIKNSTNIDLLIYYKNKARCHYSFNASESIFLELERRMRSDKLNALRLETWHMRNGEGCTMFDSECDKLINA